MPLIYLFDSYLFNAALQLQNYAEMIINKYLKTIHAFSIWIAVKSDSMKFCERNVMIKEMFYLGMVTLMEWCKRWDFSQILDKFLKYFVHRFENFL